MVERFTIEKFIERARSVHGDKYDYSKVKYKNAHTKVCIICPEHEEFWQTPRGHTLNKSGCPICYGNNRKTTKDFIKLSINVHGDKYDYSKVEYRGNKLKVCIICPDHGEFYQRSDSHLQGQGCPKCKSSKGEIEIENYLSENNINFEQQYRFYDCRNKLPLPFDFYLPDLNICIEYDGRQHIKPVEYFGGKKMYEYIKSNDRIKTGYCEVNNIRLIRIRYDEDIIKSLDQVF